MIQTADMGAQIALMNSDLPDYYQLFERVQTDMAANHKVIEKNRKILANLRAQMEDIDVDYKIFTDLSKGREVCRKKYEHYRGKLAKLREKEAAKQNKQVTSGAMMFNKGTKDHERLVRNVEKFEKAEHYF